MTDQRNVRSDEAPTGCQEKRLLIIEDDQVFRNQLARAMTQRGFTVTAVSSIAEATEAVVDVSPAYALVDLRLEDGYGLDIVPVLRKQRPDMRIVVLTGYGNIATAVASIKVGAVDYLAKPADADDIEAALLAVSRPKPPPPEKPMSVDRVRWEHIQRIYELCDRNVSETARRLNMHRRTLQRILAKHSPQ